MSEVQTALLGALRDLQHPGDDRTAVVRQTDAELHGPGVYHHGDAGRPPLRRRLGSGPQAHPCRSPADFGGSGCDRGVDCSHTLKVGGAAVPGPTGEQLCRYLQLNEVPAKPLTVGLDGRLTGEANLLPSSAKIKRITS